MSELKRTPLYDTHIAAGGEMVDFGGWEMPIQYPEGIIHEHLYTRSCCSLFDVSHMGRLLIEGPDRLAFMQHVLSSDASALSLGESQYCIIPDERGGAVDDAYLNFFEDWCLLLVVNAANTDKDIAHLEKLKEGYDCTIRDITGILSAIAVQGPRSEELLSKLAGGALVTKPKKNSLNRLELEGGHVVGVARTGYTGEPIGFEVYLPAGDAPWLWERLTELGAKPAGLGARDTLRLEAGFPLYGHEFGNDPAGNMIPIFAVPLARFAVNFSEAKGDFVGREALTVQAEANARILAKDMSGMEVLRKRVRPVALLDRGVMRAGMKVYRGDEEIGWITSGTMVPYYAEASEGEEPKVLKRAIGLAYISSDAKKDDIVEVDIRGKRARAAVVLKHLNDKEPPFARPVICSLS